MLKFQIKLKQTENWRKSGIRLKSKQRFNKYLFANVKIWNIIIRINWKQKREWDIIAQGTSFVSHVSQA